LRDGNQNDLTRNKQETQIKYTMRAELAIDTGGNNQEQDRQSQRRKCRKTEKMRDREFKIRQEPRHKNSGVGRREPEEEPRASQKQSGGRAGGRPPA